LEWVVRWPGFALIWPTLDKLLSDPTYFLVVLGWYCERRLNCFCWKALTPYLGPWIN
jgi:hypothetical protein